jgi:hypothetical protein
MKKIICILLLAGAVAAAAPRQKTARKGGQHEYDRRLRG